MPVASHCPSGLTATLRQSFKGPTRIVSSGVAIKALVKSALATIRPDRSMSIAPCLVPNVSSRGGPILNSRRPASSTIGQRCTPIVPLVIKSPEGSNIRCQALAIGKKASSVPRAR